MAYFLCNKNNDILYSETEKYVGKWINNKPIYQKCIVLNNGADIQVYNNAWTNTGVTFPGVETVLGCFGVANDGSYQGDLLAYTDNDILQLLTPRNSAGWVAVVAIRYTKTS